MSLYGYQKRTRPATWLKAFPQQAKPARRRHIASRSAAYQAASTRYRARAAVVVTAALARGEVCPVVRHVPGLGRLGSPQDVISQVHHIYGRGHGGRGPLLMDERLWLLCSAAGHAWIDANPEAARARGWLCPNGQYNTPVPATATVRRNQWGGVEVVSDMGCKNKQR